MIGGDNGALYHLLERKVNPFTLLWSIKKEKWFTGPKLPNDLFKIAPSTYQDNMDYYEIHFQEMCATSVGSNSAFIINKRKTFSFNFTTKLKVNLATICLFEKKG